MVQGRGLDVGCSVLVYKHKLAVFVHTLVYLGFVIPAGTKGFIDAEKELGLTVVWLVCPDPIVSLLTLSNRQESTPCVRDAVLAKWLLSLLAVVV